MKKEIGIKSDRLKIYYTPETGDITEQYNAEPIGKADTTAAAVEWCKKNLNLFRETKTKNEMITPGTVYDDPDGVFEVIAITPEGVEVEQVQEGNLNQGKRYIVPPEEVLYFIENPYRG